MPHHNGKTEYSVSVIIPSYNEGEDIRLSIESSLSQKFPPKEVLVIDDSSDTTPEVVGEYVSRGVRLLRGPGRGCCEARNAGMAAASGDIVVLLNADVILPEDFLSRIVAHYREGADYVLVESRVFNTEHLLARFIEAQHRFEHGNREDLEWTEGFSCRREAARAVDFIPGNFPVRFCRDWFLGKRLKAGGYRKVLDRSIVVTHKAPEQFSEYWRVRAARGRFAILAQRYLLARSRGFLFFKLVLKHALRAILFLTLVEPLQFAFRVARRSERGAVRDTVPFFGAYLAQECARTMGEWQGWFA